jgi:hypothetical protein
MTRHFVKNCNVPMGGLLIDTLAARFIKDWEYKDKSFFYYDWLFRDFFQFLSAQDTGQTIYYSIGSNRLMNNQGMFEYKAKVAYNKAVQAIEYATNGYEYSAKATWREVFGNVFPN